MAMSDPAAQLPASATDDLKYVRSTFVAMSDAVRLLVDGDVLPEATYVLADGTPMVPADHRPARAVPESLAVALLASAATWRRPNDFAAARDDLACHVFRSDGTCL
jgi:hypothetical protein